MKQLNDKISPFLTFKAEDQDFVFDGGSGLIYKVDPLVNDLLSLSPMYNLRKHDDNDEIFRILEKKYNLDEIKNAVKTMRDSFEKGFLTETEKVYDYFEKEYLFEGKESFKGNLWLSVTHNCNLNCKYCFEQSDRYLSEEQMSVETAKKCIDYWYERINREQSIYDIVFFGGEPLLNQEVIIFSVNYINHLLKNLKGIARYSITTNGTILNDKILELFKDNIFHVNVSIDGLKKIHESNRGYKSGGATYDVIIKHLNQLNKVVTRLSAYVCLTSQSIRYFQQSVTWLWSMGIKNVYGNLVFGDNYTYNFDDYMELKKQISELADISYQNIVNNDPYVYSPFIEIIKTIDRKDFTSNCYFWQNGIFIFSPSGDAYRCHRFIGDERHKLGNIENDSLDILSKKLKKEKVDKCTECWYQLYCGDGCPYEHDVYNGDINIPSEQLCVKSKITFQEGLRLYARLQIKYPQKLKSLSGGR